MLGRTHEEVYAGTPHVVSWAAIRLHESFPGK